MSKDLYIHTARNGWNFTEGKDGPIWHCMGVNYFPSDQGWAPKLWRPMDLEKTRRHFAMMQEMGINTARMFVTYGYFYPQRGALKEEAVEKMLRVCELGKEYNVRLHFTGPDHWEGPAEWTPWDGDHYADNSVIEALEEYWTLIGERFKNEPQIFAWDILNEPSLKRTSRTQCVRWKEWRLKQNNPEELPEEYPVTKDTEPEDGPVLGAVLKFRAEIAREWMERQVKAIKRVDPFHLVTCGLLWFGAAAYSPFTAFDPVILADLFDFMSMHYYPSFDVMSSQETLERNLADIELFSRYFYFNKPLVLQEYSWYGTDEDFTPWNSQSWPALTEEQQAHYCIELTERAQKYASGWMPWGLLDVPEAKDITKYSGLFTADERVKKWGIRYKEFIEGMSKKELKRLTPENRLQLNLEDLYASAHTTKERWEKWRKQLMEEGPFDFDIQAGVVK